jgi:gluconokinase
MIVILMGVAGSGKSTIGTGLAGALRCPFLDGDELHPPVNIAKLTRDVALTDTDRAPWLSALRERIERAAERGSDLVVACSALRQSYREFLGRHLDVSWVFLRGPDTLIRERLRRRTGHFMREVLLDSQLDALEEPVDAIVVDVAMPVDAAVELILRELDREHG